MVGAVLSITINWKLHVLVLPASSVAVMVTVVVPFTVVPANGDCVMLTLESQLSDATTKVV
jgi:hypothetical protein